MSVAEDCGSAITSWYPAALVWAVGDAVDDGVVDAGFIHGGADVVFVGGLIEAHGDVRATLEIHALRDAVPEEHAEDSGYGEDEREAEEVPLLAQPVDVRLLEEFHVLEFP